MTAPDRISEIYHRALGRSPGDRTAFLQQACGGDAALLPEVESLLGYEAESFLEAPGAGFAPMVNRQLGVIHRDLKPDNIILQRAANPLASDLNVKVIDFGLAKSTSVEQGPTVSIVGPKEGRILGTAAYMSPEQILFESS
jgi:serine/threonine protein kinase